MRRLLTLCLLLASITVALPTSRAQEVKSQPGQFDFYVLNLSWAPEFCSNMKTLTPREQSAAGDDMACSTPQGFVLHGLWPQNFDGTYPATCSERAATDDLKRNLDMTPNLALLRHEWAKHGTCTTLSSSTFFATARQAYTSVVIPDEFKVIGNDTALSPAGILTMFYRANPSFPMDSFALACGGNRLTAVEACFSKDTVQPIACKGISTCHADVVKITPQNDGGIVE